jgi:hypothetical protein
VQRAAQKKDHARHKYHERAVNIAISRKCQEGHPNRAPLSPTIVPSPEGKSGGGDDKVPYLR